MSTYPKWVYHAVHPATIVADAAAHAVKTAAGWVESPADVVVPVVKAAGAKATQAAAGAAEAAVTVAVSGLGAFQE